MYLSNTSIGEVSAIYFQYICKGKGKERCMHLI